MKRDRNGYMEARALKYPVILAHGVWAKDSKLFWGRIPHRLGSAGVNVFPGKTDSWSGIENNALALGEAVDSVLELCSADRVNILMTYPYLKKVAGANDGIVSLASAKWGRDFRMLGGTMPGGISHTEVIDVKRRRISGIDIPGEYLRIIDNLISKGCSRDCFA